MYKLILNKNIYKYISNKYIPNNIIKYEHDSTGNHFILITVSF